MSLKHAGTCLALLALCAPAKAFDAAQTTFYVSIPLDGKSSAPSFGLRLQGRDYQTVDIDSRVLRFVSIGGIGAGWILAGAVAVGAAAAINGDRRAEKRAAAAPRPGQPEPCPEVCN